MVFIRDDGIAAPELVPDRWGHYKEKEEPQAEELGIKQKHVWEPGWRIINEKHRIAELGISEEDIKERWWSQERLKLQGIEMPKAPKDHLNRLRTKGIDLFAEPRGSRYSLGAPPPYVTNPPEGSPLWDELQKFKRGEPSFYDTTKIEGIEGSGMTCSRNAPSQTPSVRCVHVSSQRPLKPQSVISS